MRNVSPVSIQYGALPYRFTRAGSLELLLVTTKQSKRWIIPKGRPIKGLKPAKAAAREAYEEAGVRGAVAEKSIGAFRFQKTLDGAPNVLCEVRVYPLNVKQQLRFWPEALQRTPRWFDAAEALSAVNDAGLQNLMSRFIEKMAAKSAARQKKLVEVESAPRLAD
jgi:8-oxo-dGTP pyrophosphatase MutT (NUDIX family)